MNNRTNIINTSDLRDGDIYRELMRAGDYILVGTYEDLANDNTEDASLAIKMQIGDGEDAQCRTIGYA